MAKQPKHAYPRKGSTNRSLAGPLDFHERGYLVSVHGACLEPVVYNGEVIAIEPVLPRAGELACFFFKSREKGLVKRLLKNIRDFPVHPGSTVVQLILVQQLNPPKCFQCLADQVDAIHRVVWVRRHDKWLTVASLLVGFDPTIPVLTPRQVVQAYSL
jgi:hypothetical protein